MDTAASLYRGAGWLGFPEPSSWAMLVGPAKIGHSPDRRLGLILFFSCLLSKPCFLFFLLISNHRFLSVVGPVAIKLSIVQRPGNMVPTENIFEGIGKRDYEHEVPRNKLYITPSC